MALAHSTFPALSIRQPWADLILWGVQDVENRVWSTGFRGHLLVHAGRQVDRRAIDHLEDWFGIVLPPGYRPRTGAILGMARLVDCVRASPSPFFSGPCGFVLRDPVDFGNPIPFPGRLGIFQVPRSTLTGTPAFDALPGSD